MIHQFHENGDICSVTFVLALRISLSSFLGALLSVLRNNLLRARIRNALLNLMVNSKLTLICSSMFSFLLETAQSAFHALRPLPGAGWMVPAGIGTLVPRVQGLSEVLHVGGSIIMMLFCLGSNGRFFYITRSVPFVWPPVHLLTIPVSFHVSNIVVTRDICFPLSFTYIVSVLMKRHENSKLVMAKQRCLCWFLHAKQS